MCGKELNKKPESEKEKGGVMERMAGSTIL